MCNPDASAPDSANYLMLQLLMYISRGSVYH